MCNGKAVCDNFYCQWQIVLHHVSPGTHIHQLLGCYSSFIPFTGLLKPHLSKGNKPTEPLPTVTCDIKMRVKCSFCQYLMVAPLSNRYSVSKSESRQTSLNVPFTLTLTSHSCSCRDLKDCRRWRIKWSHVAAPLLHDGFALVSPSRHCVHHFY